MNDNPLSDEDLEPFRIYAEWVLSERIRAFKELYGPGGIFESKGAEWDRQP